MLGFQALGRLALGQIPAPPGIEASSGAFALTVNTAILDQGLTASTGSFTITGVAATLVYVTGEILSPETGVFTLTGQDAGLDIYLGANPGSFTLTGIAAGLDLTMPAAVGSFTLSGPTTILARDLILYASGSFVREEADYFLFAPLGSVALGRADVNEEFATTFALTGQDANGYSTTLLTAEYGTFTFTGKNVTLVTDAYSSKIRVFPSIGRGAKPRALGTSPLRVFPSTGTGAKRRAFGG